MKLFQGSVLAKAQIHSIDRLEIFWRLISGSRLHYAHNGVRRDRCKVFDLIKILTPLVGKLVLLKAKPFTGPLRDSAFVLIDTVRQAFVPKGLSDLSRRN